MIQNLHHPRDNALDPLALTVVVQRSSTIFLVGSWLCERGELGSRTGAVTMKKLVCVCACMRVGGGFNRRGKFIPIIELV